MLNAQEELRKSFIFLIKTDSGPEGFKLLSKPKALSSRFKMDDSETSKLLYKNICLYPCEKKKHMFSFALSIFQKKLSAKVGINLMLYSNSLGTLGRNGRNNHLN